MGAAALSPGDGAGSPAARPLRLHIRGFRGIGHSFALVNQWQILSLLRRQDVRLSFTDMPWLRSRWKPEPGLFGPAQEAAIRAIPPEAGEPADVEYRIYRPDFTELPDTPQRLLVFVVCEYKGGQKDLAGVGSFAEVNQRERPVVVVPSRWVRESFVSQGLDDLHVAVVPHGVDVTLFRPNPAARATIRERLKLDGFVFLNVGGMFHNKGIDLLLRAFARLRQRGIEAKLVLKGSDSLYPSKDLVQRELAGLDAATRDLVVADLAYVGQSLGPNELAALYAAADAYVSPYRAEGFNMPVLEAAATGLPVICTLGGATDDFATDAFRRGIIARPARAQDGREFLEPDLDHLTELMAGMVTDEAFQRLSRQEGPRHAAAHFTWDHAVERLLEVARHRPS